MSWLTRLFRRDAAPAPAAKRLRAARADGYENCVTGLGTIRDKRMAGYFNVEPVPALVAQRMRRGDDAIKRTIELYPAEAFRKGYAIKATDKDEAERIDAWGEEMHADARIKEAVEQMRTTGGAAIFPVLRDGSTDPSTPLDEGAIVEVAALHVLESRELYPVSWYRDITHPKWSRPECYRVLPLIAGGGTVVSNLVEIHESRLVIFCGPRVTRMEMPGAVYGWGDNVVTPVMQVMLDFASAYPTAAALLADFGQAVYGVDGLEDLLDKDGDGVYFDLVRKMDFARSVLRGVVIGSKDTFDRKATPLTGLADILDRLASRAAAAAELPVTRFMGTSPAGLASVGKGEQDMIDAKTSSLQQDITPQVRQVLRFGMLARQGPTGGKVPKQWSIEWLPLSMPTAKEVAETRFVDAQTDEKNIQNGVYSADDAAKSRYGGDTYGSDITIDWVAREKQAAVDDTQDAEMLAALKAGKAATPPGAVPVNGAPIPPPAQTRADFSEDDHPRAENGEFGEGDGKAKESTATAARGKANAAGGKAHASGVASDHVAAAASHREAAAANREASHPRVAAAHEEAAAHHEAAAKSTTANAASAYASATGDTKAHAVAGEAHRGAAAAHAEAGRPDAAASHEHAAAHHESEAKKGEGHEGKEHGGEGHGLGDLLKAGTGLVLGEENAKVLGLKGE